VAPSSCGRYFFQKVHCLTRGPLPMSVLLMSNVRYSLLATVCGGHRTDVLSPPLPTFGSLDDHTLEIRSLCHASHVSNAAI